MKTPFPEKNPQMSTRPYQIAHLCETTRKLAVNLELKGSFSSYIIGTNSICIQCANLLLEFNHKILGIATSDPIVEKWSQEASIPCLYFVEHDELVSEKLFEFFSQSPFDYLFSLDNPVILHDNILDLPQVFAINYHDALLPKYGGVNATSWAVYNRERIHGITWHVIDRKVDAGDVLKQSSIDLSENETALTLNAKCYESAITTFQELIDDLAYGNVESKAQDLRERTFFPSYLQPTHGCVLDWFLPSDQLDSLVRSLDFGNYPNPLGMPKIYIDGEFVIITKLKILDSKSEELPGTILAIDDKYIQVATSEFDVAIGGFRQINGYPLRVRDFFECFKLQRGFQFPKLDPEFGGQIAAINREICQYETYWVRRLRLLKPLQFPYLERETVGLRSAHYEIKELVIPDDLRSYHQNHNFEQTFRELILSIFAVYLSRLTGIYNFDIGYRNQNIRRTINGHGLDRLFSSFVPLRVELDQGKRFIDGLVSINTQIKICNQRKIFALDALARYPNLKPANDIHKNITVIFDLDVVEHEPDLNDYDLRSGSDLVIKIPERINLNSNSKIIWKYNSGCLDPENIIRMQEQFLILLRSVIENSNQSIDSLPLLSEPEVNQILIEWNKKRADYPHNKCIHELFEEQAERAPDNTAVVFENEYMTYKELNTSANQLSYVLQYMGVGPEVMVGLYVERSLDMIIGLLGILKAGGAYVPLNLADPKERLENILNDTKVKVLLTKESLKDRLPPTDAELFCLDSDWHDIDVGNIEVCAYEPMADNLAYVIYTSGSTGEPKGVMMSHRSLVNRFLWELDVFQRNENDRILQQFSLSFDYSVWEIFVTLTSGACLILAKPHGQMDSEYLTRLIKEHNITEAGFVPSMLDAILNEPNMEDSTAVTQAKQKR